MKFLEHTGKNQSDVQLRAVEMEIEQQKLEWEEKRQAQRHQEELDKQRADNEENEILTYSRDDALNKVNITSKKKSLVLGKRKSESANNSTKSNAHGKKNNGTETAQNGIFKETEQKTIKSRRISLLKTMDVPRRNTRNSLNRSVGDDISSNKLRGRKSSPMMTSQRGTSRKSERSTSIQSRKSQTRSTSESTGRSAADSASRQTLSNVTPDDTDSECSLDVMIDSNDVNDSDSNSNQNNVNEKIRGRLDSTSRDDGTLMNDDSTMSDDTRIDRMIKNSSRRESRIASSPRTRSRGTVNVNLWTLDESSPILPVKRQKVTSKSSSESKRIDEKQIRSSFGVKECKVSIVDIKSDTVAHRQPSTSLKPSLMSRVPKKLFNVKKNTSLDKWSQKPTDPLLNADPTDSVKDEPERVTRQRRHTILINKTL